jgi:NADPH:quinone reductase-like Zn-dependent oxidoreductase
MPKAVKFDKYGDRDVLYVADIDAPKPGAGEVVVAVKAAGTNPGEAAIRRGALDDVSPATFPSGQGSDLAGIITAVGDGVTDFAVDDEVLGWSEARSSQAELVAVPTTQLIPKPPDMPWEVAGSLYVVGVTAQVAVDTVEATADDTVVVSAAAGGVGSVVVQLLRLRGATVIGIASEPSHDWLRSIDVIPISYGDDLEDRVRDVAPDGVNALIDTHGPEYVDLGLSLAVSPSRINTIIAFDAAQKVGANAEGSQSPDKPKAVLSKVVDLVAEGQVEIPIAATYPLSEVQAAYAELEKRHTHGKIVLLPGAAAA